MLQQSAQSAVYRQCQTRYLCSDQTDLCIDDPSGLVHISNIIAELVITRVIPISRFSTKDRLLLFTLDSFCSSGDASTWNASTNETVVVTATIEGDEGVIQTLLFVPMTALGLLHILRE